MGWVGFLADPLRENLEPHNVSDRDPRRILPCQHLWLPLRWLHEFLPLAGFPGLLQRARRLDGLERVLLVTAERSRDRVSFLPQQRGACRAVGVWQAPEQHE